ncbi:MAG: hypothetical protein ACLSB9_21510 [Hydrogeniiclostridium mannosilyticum]
MATVDADGKVTAVANGECVVTVSRGDITDRRRRWIPPRVKVETWKSWRVNCAGGCCGRGRGHHGGYGQLYHLS